MEYNNGKGNNPGDMSPKVQDYQPKMNEFVAGQEGKTTQYISRRDRLQTHEANKVRSQPYKGRYD
ncbi:MAG TPA: hypothetical protein VGK47_14915 [Nitrososphaeraceae archaeon]